MKKSFKPRPWKEQKQKLTAAEAFKKAAETLWTPESIRLTEELAMQLQNPVQKVAA